MNIAPPQEWFSVLLRLPDVMKQETEALDESEWNTIERAINQAVDEVIAFRKQEGEMLTRVLKEKIQLIRSLLADVEPFELERIETIKNRIYDGLRNLEGVEYDKTVSSRK